MVGAVEVKQLRAAVNRRRPSLSVARQCKLLDISRSGLYYQPARVSDEDLSLDETDRLPVHGHTVLWNP